MTRQLLTFHVWNSSLSFSTKCLLWKKMLWGDTDHRTHHKITHLTTNFKTEDGCWHSTLSFSIKHLLWKEMSWGDTERRTHSKIVHLTKTFKNEDGCWHSTSFLTKDKVKLTRQLIIFHDWNSTLTFLHKTFTLKGQVSGRN